MSFIPGAAAPPDYIYFAITRINRWKVKKYAQNFNETKIEGFFEEPLVSCLTF